MKLSETNRISKGITYVIFRLEQKQNKPNQFNQTLRVLNNTEKHYSI